MPEKKEYIDISKLETKLLWYRSPKDYEDKIGGDSLYELLLYKGDRCHNQDKAFLIKAIREFAGVSMVSDMLFMAFGLLQQYEELEKIGDRRTLFINRSKYLDHFYKDEAEIYRAMQDGDEKSKMLTRYSSNLHKKENTHVGRLALHIAKIQNMVSYINDLDGFAVKQTENNKTAFKLILPAPSYLRDELYEELPSFDESKAYSPTIKVEKEETLSPFAQYIDGERPLAPTESDYDFRAGNIPFCFRQDELRQLERFCADDRPVSWWAITGAGGSGKSRLAYEYMQKHSSDEWKILFLREEFFSQVGGVGKYQQFNDWSHPQNLMLIVDDVGRYPDAVAQWIENIIARKSESPKIRVLLLGRGGEDELWYMCFKDTLSLFAYRYGPFLALQPLSGEELRVFAQEYSQAKGLKIDESNIDNIAAALPEVDGEQSILYLMLLLDTAAEQGVWSHNNKEVVLDYILERELRTIKTRFRGNNKALKLYMQLLIYATATTGVNVSDPPECLKEKCTAIFDEFPDATSALKAMGAQDGVLRPFTPDLIGEYLVLTTLEEYFPFKADIEWFVKNTWNNSPNELVDFLLRVDSDFKVSCYNGWYQEILSQHINDDYAVTQIQFNLSGFVMLRFVYRQFLFVEQLGLYIWETHRWFTGYFHQREKEYSSVFEQLQAYGENSWIKSVKNTIDQGKEGAGERLKSMWEKYQSFIAAYKLSDLVNKINRVITWAIEKRAIVLECAKLLCDISAMQSRRLDLYVEIFDHGAHDILKLPLDADMEADEYRKLEDFKVLARITYVLYELTRMPQYDNDVDIAELFSSVVINSLYALSSEEGDMIFNYTRGLAEKYNTPSIWKNYIAALGTAADLCEDAGQKDDVVRQLQCISLQNSDNDDVVSECDKYIELIRDNTD